MVDRVLKSMSELTARDRSNLRFYVLFWLSCVLTGKASPKAGDIVKIDMKTVDDTNVEAAADEIWSIYQNLGADDQVAKGPERDVDRGSGPRYPAHSTHCLLEDVTSAMRSLGFNHRSARFRGRRRGRWSTSPPGRPQSLQLRIDAFAHPFNHTRPHQALGDLSPQPS